jgi:hypothetical protein
MGDLGENNGPALRRSKWWKTCPASSSSGVDGGIILLACYSIDREPLKLLGSRHHKEWPDRPPADLV